MRKLSRFLVICMIMTAMFSGCASHRHPLMINYNNTQPLIPVPAPTPENMVRFNPDIRGDSLVVKKDSLEISGYKTANQVFLYEVMLPLIEPHLESLAQLTITERINALALFTHQIYQNYLGHDFYRWGGDLLDLDDPQDESIRYDRRFGLDCSGFAVSAYELAAILDLLPESDPGAIFSSRGFKKLCQSEGRKDLGGRFSTSNNYRLDTSDLARLGREIFTIPKGGKPTREQVELLQAGDLAGRSGHFGIMVWIEKEFYYLESGGWVVPPNGGFPYRAAEALEIFARNGPVTVRRALKDIR